MTTKTQHQDQRDGAAASIGERAAVGGRLQGLPVRGSLLGFVGLILDGRRSALLRAVDGTGAVALRGSSTA